MTTVIKKDTFITKRTQRTVITTKPVLCLFKCIAYKTNDIQPS